MGKINSSNRLDFFMVALGNTEVLVPANGPVRALQEAAAFRDRVHEISTYDPRAYKLGKWASPRLVSMPDGLRNFHRKLNGSSAVYGPRFYAFDEPALEAPKPTIEPRSTIDDAVARDERLAALRTHLASGLANLIEKQILEEQTDIEHAFRT